MNNLQVIERNNERVLTTQQLADVYETEIRNISNNFNNNKERFIEGKHYFCLQGDDLRAFKRDSYDIRIAPNVNKLYLWTERGANRHCKILDTDKAWEQFDNLEESYFNKKKDTLITNQLSPELQLFKQIFDTVAKQEIEQKQIKQDITETKQEIKSIKDVVTLNTTDWREETRKLIVSMAQNLGGNEYINTLRKESYELLCKRFNVDLKRRLNNRRSKMAEKGVCKSRREKFNYLDVIQEQNYLIEGYVIVIKDMAIKYGVFMEKTN
ncbi:TPA: ORF6N domain-containing protein [Clostridioides difficile]|uniref:ORF6N domain-containing protein n=1 Tax=Clostridioides difficile TaxID=1496 RepID=UPI0009392B09|nr:ORF6N domain-containing protein [Clostridioides difficile]MBY2845896.1 ORF6N domain-containing protein [Clostridioides difficile]MBZ0913446.1 ORF6N domain-containing protein [Clostridioides difficile]MCI4779177.1 ORF6N domain-containing protein [Clostridioides difficile]MCL6900051.1 ORF6N domain-containing protein [Clostridioides difficile]MDE3491716.1 ORF6N domain-containing protein [Clostridioides difficile]